MWEKYNPNPTGRDTIDCAIRAVAAALDVDWETAFALVSEMAFDMGGMPSENAVWGAVLRQHGFYKMNVPHDCPDCYTAEEFARENPVGTFVTVFSGHVAVIRDGILLDSWNSSREIVRAIWYRKDGK